MLVAACVLLLPLLLLLLLLLPEPAAAARRTEAEGKGSFHTLPPRPPIPPKEVNVVLVSGEGKNMRGSLPPEDEAVADGCWVAAGLGLVPDPAAGAPKVEDVGAKTPPAAAAAAPPPPPPLEVAPPGTREKVLKGGSTSRCKAGVGLGVAVAAPCGKVKAEAAGGWFPPMVLAASEATLLRLKRGLLSTFPSTSMAPPPPLPEGWLLVVVAVTAAASMMATLQRLAKRQRAALSLPLSLWEADFSVF